jgi:adenylate kinase family enzyme
MKIALIGAQGVGKTTLAHKLGGKIVPEVARSCPYPIDTAADFRTEWWMVAHSILAELSAARELKPRELLVADRCALDIAVYSRLVYERDPRAVTYPQLRLIESTIQSWLEIANYDHMFLITVNEDYWLKRDLNDGFRSLDLEWYRKLTKGFIQATGLIPLRTKVHTVVNNDSIERLVCSVQAEMC